MARHDGSLYDVPGYVARMMGIEDADSEEDVRIPRDGSYGSSGSSSFPSTFVHNAATRGTQRNPFSGATASASGGTSASHVHRLLRQRSDGRMVGRPGEADDVRLMRQRLQAMEATRTDSVPRQAPAGPPPGTSLAASTPAGRSIGYPQRGRGDQASTVPASRSVPVLAPRTQVSTRQLVAASQRHASSSDSDDDSSDGSSDDDSSDSDSEADPDQMMQMMRIQQLIQTAPPGSSSGLVQWLMSQRGPPSTIMRDFESMLRAQGGGPSQPSQPQLPRPRPAPSPTPVPVTSASAPTGRSVSTQQRLAQQFDALAAQGVWLNPDGSSVADVLDSDALRAGLGLGMGLAREMAGRDAVGPSTLPHRPQTQTRLQAYDDDTILPSSLPPPRGVDARQWFHAMRDDAAARLASGHVVSRVGGTHTMGAFDTGGVIRPAQLPSSRTIVLMPMPHLEDQIQTIAESIAASFMAANPTANDAATASAPQPKPKRRVANVPDGLPMLTAGPASADAKTWKCDKCAHVNDALTLSCGKCFGPSPPKPSPQPDLPAGCAIVPSQTDSECVICFDGPKDTLLAPCGHVCCCISCANTLLGAEDNCPVCRSFIENAYKVYAV